jgi:hypothetical protein
MMTNQSETMIQVDDEVRKMTSDELKAFQEFQTSVQAEENARILSRQSALSKLAALGLTEEEIAAL